MAEAHKKKGDYKNAIKELEYVNKHQWATIFEGIPSVWVLSNFYLGQLYELKNDSTKAIFYYQNFLSIWSHADKDLKEIEFAKVSLDRLKNIDFKLINP